MSKPAAADGRTPPPGSPWWYALLFTPAPPREGVAALLELRAEILASARRPAEPAVAFARLEWWRDELAAFGRGQEQHPATRRLRGADPEGVVQAEYLLELVDAAASERTAEPCRNYAELALYCYRSSGVLHEMISALLGTSAAANERGVRRHAQRLGTGSRLVEIIGDLEVDLAGGRRLLPRDWIAETGAVESIDRGGELNAALAACLDRLAGEARLALDEADRALPAAERARQRPGLVLAALHRQRLAHLHRAGFIPAARPGNLSSLWTAWRAARRTVRGHSDTTEETHEG